MDHLTIGSGPFVLNNRCDHKANWTDEEHDHCNCKDDYFPVEIHFIGPFHWSVFACVKAEATVILIRHPTMETLTWYNINQTQSN